MGLKKRAFFFTVDALLAAAILLGGIVLLSSHYLNKQPTIHLNYLSQDILLSLDTLTIDEVNNSYISSLIADGTITNINNSLLQQIGVFWAAQNYTLARNFISNLTADIIPSRYGLGVWVSDDMIYQRDNPPPRSRSSARKLISGIEKNKPIDGYISKARANSFTTTRSKIISFSPEGAGWDGDYDDAGEAVVDKYFEIPANLSITNATLFLSLHIEDGGPDWEVVNINNGSCIVNKNDITFAGEEGVFNTFPLAGCFLPGQNQARLRLRNIGYNGHIHPGMLIRIDYAINESTTTYNNTFSQRYYLDNVVSNEGDDGKSGAWQIIPFYIPEDASNVSVGIRIEGRNIRDYTGSSWFVSWSGWRRRRDYDYVFFINSDDYFDRDTNPSANPSYQYSPTDLAGVLITGTNVASVYFNNYGDYEWGSGQPQIYSDPFNDPDGSSFIEVNYTLPAAAIPYGNIRINQLQEFGGSADWEKETSFSFPQQANEMGDIFTHIVQQYSYIVDVEADTYTPPSNIVFSSPSSRAVPTTVFIPNSNFDISPTANNYVRISDRNRNDILPDSYVEYNFYVPSFVSYGGVFATQSEAEDDALVRLNQTLGSFISSDDIVVESNEMKDVPTMWGPAVLEVKVWY